MLRKNLDIVVIVGILLLCIFLYWVCSVVNYNSTDEDAGDIHATSVAIPIKKANKASKEYLDLLTVKFSKFQATILAWNEVSGDTWRWDSWDRARQGKALMSWDRARQGKALMDYLVAYNDLYLLHEELDAGKEARLLWIYAYTMERVSTAESCSYAEALEAIVDKDTKELVGLLKSLPISPAAEAEIKKM